MLRWRRPTVCEARLVRLDGQPILEGYTVNALKLATFTFSLLLVSLVLETATGADGTPETPEAVYGPEIEKRWFSHLSLLDRRGTLMHGLPYSDQNYDPNDINDIKRAAIDPQVPSYRRAALVLLIYQIRDEAKEMLLSALADPDVGVRCVAAQGLAILGDPNGLASMRRDFAELTKEPADVNVESMSTRERVRQDFSAKHPYTRTRNALQVAQALAEFGDTTGFTLASQVILQEEASTLRHRAAKIVAELGKVPDAELKAKNCDPETVLIAMVERETDLSILKGLSGVVMRTMKVKPGSMVRVLEEMERSPVVDEQYRPILRTSIERGKKAMAEEGEGPKDR